MIKHSRTYNLNEDGLFVSIRKHGIFLHERLYSTAHIAKIEYFKIRIDIEVMNIFVYNKHKELTAKIIHAKRIWDMR